MAEPFSFEQFLALMQEHESDPEALGILADLRAAFAAGDIEQVGWQTIRLMQESRFFRAGVVSYTAGRRGGLVPKNDQRNMELARKYNDRRPTSKLSPSALKADIGRKHRDRRLGRSAAIKAINDGLDLLQKSSG